MVLRRGSSNVNPIDQNEVDAMTSARVPQPYDTDASAPEEETAGQSSDLVVWFNDNFPTMLEDPSMIAGRIVEQILNTSADDVLDMGETLPSAKGFANRPMIVNRVEAVMPSTYGGIYVILNVTDLATGEQVNVSVGSPTILAQLKVLHEGGKLPLECKIAPIKRGPKDGKNPPLYLRKVTY